MTDHVPGPGSDPCARKAAFTESGARAELALIVKRSMTGERVKPFHMERGVYECGRCAPPKNWHLTHRPVDDQIVARRAT